MQWSLQESRTAQGDAGRKEGEELAARHRMERERATECLEGFVILKMDCLVTVIVQKY